MSEGLEGAERPPTGGDGNQRGADRVGAPTLRAGSTLRVGSVPYLVGRPLDLGLEDEPGVNLVRRPPSQLVDGLRAGDLDVALVSSIELFRRPGYGYLNGYAVFGEGRVSSVQLFLRRPVETLERVALDPASRTSAALVQVLLADVHGAQPQFAEPPDGVDPRDAEADAWLRIGDRALRETFAANPPPAWNPSEAWRAHTGLPFVFALWISAPGVDLGPWRGAFERARERGRAAAPALARNAARATGLPEGALLHYLLEECAYEPGARLGASLTAWRDRAAAHGLCDGDLEPIFG